MVYQYKVKGQAFPWTPHKLHFDSQFSNVTPKFGKLSLLFTVSTYEGFKDPYLENSMESHEDTLI